MSNLTQIKIDNRGLSHQKGQFASKQPINPSILFG